MLIERARNIRKQLSKLCTFGKSCASATGGGHLPPGDMPKVSFEMSDAVRAYAATINFKFVGLPLQGDSDMPLAGSSNSATPTTTPTQCNCSMKLQVNMPTQNCRCHCRRSPMSMLPCPCPAIMNYETAVNDSGAANIALNVTIDENNDDGNDAAEFVH